MRDVPTFALTSAEDEIVEVGGTNVNVPEQEISEGDEEGDGSEEEEGEEEEEGDFDSNEETDESIDQSLQLCSMSGRGGRTSRGRGRGRGGGCGRGGGRITFSTTPANDPASGQRQPHLPPYPLLHLLLHGYTPTSTPIVEHSQPDMTSTPDTSEASRIVTDADRFLPSSASTQEMSDVFKLMCDTPWLCYNEVPIELKDQWFDKWMESFYFEEPVNRLIVRMAFDYRIGRIHRQMLRKVRLENEKSTRWMTPTLKREVRNKFATDEGFQHCSATKKVNRRSAKGGSVYCGGSATIPSTQERMKNELNREPTLAEAAHQSAHEGNDSNSPAVVYRDEVWLDVVGEPRKNNIYGVGSYFSRTLCIDLRLRSSRGTREPPLSQFTVEELRTQIHGLTQELHQKVQHNEENEERVQQLLTQAELKMSATVEQARHELVKEREELLREREEYWKMREEMAAYYANMRATGSGIGSHYCDCTSSTA
ncbi:hypothetical protein PIB30_010076 [Stylosanthes scabra]|uniref:Uncharacterized protein n=1 Tax=Stylosanthes scabra TaxID=79078 RepID=A0ABU6X799_9FABA|nr:hypothetical protein [Stylosanthes scabra]